MKLKSPLFIFCVFATTASTLHAAAIFTDSTGDVAVPGNPYPHLDITSVDVSNDNTTLTFKINLNGDPVTTNWGKYMIGISTTVGGDTASNGWGRPISMQDGMEHWIGSWVDSGNGAELWDYTGSWIKDSNTPTPNTSNLSISRDTSSVTISLDFASLGLALDNSFTFDVYSSGGGGSDGAVDGLSASSPSISNWGESYQTPTASTPSYTLVPETASVALGLIGALLILRRRK
ncbi:MAG: hypothetical protein V4819_02410 [Verrucomicrobiota bacterium]